MTRNRTLLAALLPAAFAGGLVGVTATTTFADDPDTARAEADAARRAARAEKQAAKQAKQQVKMARKMALRQLEEARKQIRHAPLPDDLRDKLDEKLDRVAEAIDRHMDRAAQGDMAQLEAEMEAMGAEIEKEMESFGTEMEAMGQHWEEWAKQFEDQQGRTVMVFPDSKDLDFDFDFDPPEPPVPPIPPNVAPTAPTAPFPIPPAPRRGLDVDMSDLDISIDTGDLSLAPDQVDALHAIFEEEQRVVEPAREAIEQTSDALRDALEDPNVRESDVVRMVDDISQEEAKIRKAQILAWVKSRKILDEDQRDVVEKSKIKVRAGRRNRDR